MGISNKRTRLIIYRGTDVNQIFSLVNSITGRIVQLTGVTKITATFIKSDRSKLRLDTNEIPAVKAYATYSTILFTAISGGSTGNDIALIFDGVKTVTQIVNDWNTANPGNKVEHNSDGTSVLDSKTLDLENGFNAYKPIKIIDSLNGIILITLINMHTSLLRLGENQDINLHIDFGEYPTGTRIKGTLSQKLDIF